MNASIDNLSQNINETIIISPPKPLNFLLQRKSWQQQDLLNLTTNIERKSVKKLSRRKKFIRTLENETSK